ncbi:MAG: hypothetical protein ACJAXE_001557 [Neolewinella sp.]|jgi:hypothetical protein
MVRSIFAQLKSILKKPFLHLRLRLKTPLINEALQNKTVEL